MSKNTKGIQVTLEYLGDLNQFQALDFTELEEKTINL